MSDPAQTDGAENTTAVLDIPFVDQNGDDLGNFHVDPVLTVAEMIQEVVEESGLPLHNHDGSPRKYEGFHGGRKLAPSAPVRDQVVDPKSTVEVVPSVTTGRAC